jgi:transposase-like protein
VTDHRQPTRRGQGALEVQLRDKVMDGMAEWQNRPLDPFYPVTFIGVHVKVRVLSTIL